MLISAVCGPSKSDTALIPPKRKEVGISIQVCDVWTGQRGDPQYVISSPLDFRPGECRQNSYRCLAWGIDFGKIIGIREAGCEVVSAVRGENNKQRMSANNVGTGAPDSDFTTACVTDVEVMVRHIQINSGLIRPPGKFISTHIVIAALKPGIHVAVISRDVSIRSSVNAGGIVLKMQICRTDKGRIQIDVPDPGKSTSYIAKGCLHEQIRISGHVDLTGVVVSDDGVADVKNRIILVGIIGNINAAV